MRWYETIIAAHTAVSDAVSHARYMNGDRYFVWQEDGSNDYTADDVHAGRAVTGTTDLYTRVEFDPWVDELGNSFDTYGIFWNINSIQYEEDTGFYHIEWRWEVIDNG